MFRFMLKLASTPNETPLTPTTRHVSWFRSVSPKNNPSTTSIKRSVSQPPEVKRERYDKYYTHKHMSSRDYMEDDRSKFSQEDEYYAAKKSLSQEYHTVEQYELEAARPRDPNAGGKYNVRDYIASIHWEKNTKGFQHLQPGSLKPYGSMENAYQPSIMVPKIDNDKYPRKNPLENKQDKDTEEATPIDYTTFSVNNLSLKENPGFSPTKKSVKLVKGSNQENDERKPSTNYEVLRNYRSADTKSLASNQTYRFEDVKSISRKYQNYKFDDKKSLYQKLAPPENAKPLEQKFSKLKQTPVVKKHVLRAKDAISCRSWDNRSYRFEDNKSITGKYVTPETKSIKEKNQNQSYRFDDSKSMKSTRSYMISPIKAPAIVKKSYVHSSKAKNDTTSLGVGSYDLPIAQRKTVPWPSYSERLQTDNADNISIVGFQAPSTAILKKKGSTLAQDALSLKSFSQFPVIAMVKSRNYSTSTKNNNKNHKNDKKKDLEENIEEEDEEEMKLRKNIDVDGTVLKKCFCPVPRLQRAECVPPWKSCSVPVCEVKVPPKVHPKQLPKIRRTVCPCVEPELPTVMPRMRRLNMKFVDPPKLCDQIEGCGPRADDGVEFLPKPLRIYVPGECSCIENDPLVDIPLKRLPKVDIPEPERRQDLCLPPVCKRSRADHNALVKPKSLPKIPKGPCPCVDTPIPTRSFKLKRLNIKLDEVPRVCPPPYPPCGPRADDDLVLGPRTLPKFVPGECDCVENPKLTDVPLKRLVRKCDDEPFNEAYCKDTPRADQGCWKFAPPWCSLKLKERKRIAKASRAKKRKYSTYTPAGGLLQLRSLAQDDFRRCYSKKAKDKSKSKKKKKKKPCKEYQGCPKFLMDRCKHRERTVCDNLPRNICCEKVPSPYPAFSEIMEIAVNPFAKKCICPRKKEKLKRRTSFSTYTKNLCSSSGDFLQKPSSFTTQSRTLASASNVKKKGGSREVCKKKGRRKPCRKFNLDDCVPTVSRHYDCKELPPHPPCKKRDAPYPSFSDCIDQELEAIYNECPAEIDKLEILQPKHDFASFRTRILQPTFPPSTCLDTLKEEDCIREKLCLESKGVSQSCHTFGEFVKPMRAKNYIQPAKNEYCEKLKKTGVKMHKGPLRPKRRFSSWANVSDFKPAKREFCSAAVMPRSTPSIIDHILKSLEIRESIGNSLMVLGHPKHSSRMICTNYHKGPITYNILKSKFSKTYKNFRVPKISKKKRMKSSLNLSCQSEDDVEGKPSESVGLKMISMRSASKQKNKYFIEKDPANHSCPKMVWTCQEVAECYPKSTIEIDAKECLPKSDLETDSAELSKTNLKVTSGPCSEHNKKPVDTWWTRIVNYFKAREGCPTAEEIRQNRLKEKAIQAADKIGLYLIDPKDLPPNTKPINAKSIEDLDSCFSRQNQKRHYCSWAQVTRGYSKNANDDNEVLDDDLSLEDEMRMLRKIMETFKKNLEILERKGVLHKDDPEYQVYKQLENISESKFNELLLRQTLNDDLEDDVKTEPVSYSCKLQPVASKTKETFCNDLQTVDEQLGKAFHDFLSKYGEVNLATEVGSKNLLEELDALLRMNKTKKY